MRKPYLFSMFFLFHLVFFAQSQEIKSATKLLKSGNPTQAISILEGVPISILSKDVNVELSYYKVMADAQYSKSKLYPDSSFEEAIRYYKLAKALSEKQNDQRKTEEIQEKLTMISVDLVNSAVADNENGDYSKSATKLFRSYTVSPRDTIYLYYAASAAVAGEDYESALKYYSMLKTLNYDGSEVRYSAREKSTGKRFEMPKEQRDLVVRAGTYDEPSYEILDSKKCEISKNYFLINSMLGKLNDAYLGIFDAINCNPNDTSLYIQKASICFDLLKYEEAFDALYTSVIREPNNPDVRYLALKFKNEAQRQLNILESNNKSVNTNSPEYISRQKSIFNSIINYN